MALPTSSILLDLAAVIQRIADLFGLDSEVVRRNGVRILIIWITAFVIHQMIRIIAARIVRRASDSNDKLLTHREKRASTISGVMRGVGGALVILFAVILTLDVFINIGPLLAGAGVAGLAISFGSQSLVRDVISGFFLLIENQFDVGDVVDLAGLSGSVEHMTLRVTQLRDVEGAVHLIPNGQILTVTNRTRGWSRAVVDIGVGYGAPIDHAIEVLRDEVDRFAAEPAWGGRLDGAPEVIGVQALGEASVTLRVLLRTRPGMQWEVGREFRRRAKNRLDSEGIEIPNPKRMVNLSFQGGQATPADDDNSSRAVK